MSSDEKTIVLPDGRNIKETDSTVTVRGLKRLKEDEDYIPVIIKRNDEIRRHPDDILERVIHEGLEQIERPFLSLALSSMAAGLILGFSVMAVAVVAEAVSPLNNMLLTRLAMAVVYPLGFIICILSGTQLFTEHTATAVYPVLDRKASMAKLLKIWSIVISGNLIGTLGSAILITATDSVIHAENGYLFIAEHLVQFESSSLLLSAMLAGWLMAQGAWLVVGSTQGISQIFCIYIVTFLIGIGGLHHSVAGSAEMFVAVLISDLYTIPQAIWFVGCALFGNMVGGSLFVAVLNYGHIRQTQFRGVKS